MRHPESDSVSDSVFGPVSARAVKYFYNVHLEPKEAWICTTFVALVNILGMLLQLAINDIPNLPREPMMVSMSVGFLVLGLQLSRYRRPSNRFSYALYLFNHLAVATTFFITNPYFAAGPKDWVPFQAAKLGCFVSALLSPGFWVGTMGISIHSLGSAIQFQYFPEELKARVSAEPVVSLVFGIVALLILIYRFRRVALLRELMAIRARAEADHQMARTFMMIRDRMNTPLQVLELGVAMLRSKPEPAPEALDKIERAAQSLQELNKVLNPPEARP